MAADRVINPPWHFRAAKWLIRHGIRGPGLWLRAAHSLGLLNRQVRYPITPEVLMDVPIGRRENQWDIEEVRQYESELFRVLVPRVQELPEPVTLVDAGADIGIFSVLLAARAPNVSRIIACEPNEEAFEILNQNLGRLAASTRPLRLALSDFSGKGKLVRPSYDPHSAHAAYLEQDPEGKVNVTTVEALGVADGASLVLKIDVEGGEEAVIRGAMGAIRRAPQVVVVFEANRRVFERTDVDPATCLRHLTGLRPMQICVAEAPEQKLHPHRPFFGQYKDRDVYNLVLWG